MGDDVGEGMVVCSRGDGVRDWLIGLWGGSKRVLRVGDCVDKNYYKSKQVGVIR